jgi:hypothetical protein
MLVKLKRKSRDNKFPCVWVDVKHLTLLYINVVFVLNL